MKNLISFATALLLLLSFASCRKINATKGIAFGDNSKMEITVYDTVADYLEKAIDVNGDGKEDLLLSLTYPGSAGLGHWMKASIKCMPGTGLLGEIIDQKNYIHLDTTYRISDDGNVVTALFDTYNTCNMMSENDSIIINKDRFVLYANDEGDIFHLDDTFLDTEATIFEGSYQVPMGYTEPINDTVSLWTHHYLNDCENFPLDTPKYIGFKLLKNNTTRLGWVKIKVGQYNTIELIETAIQK
ncbi:MAG: hypothetical protein II829_07105 [Bacteroidales bacterium]|nr:hypothetical protein [Bacteroidales bacterium]